MSAERKSDRLTSKELRALNAYLKPLGTKVCCNCQGRPLPRDEAHFYRKGKGWHSECKACLNARSKRNTRRRYLASPDEARKILERNRKYWFSHHDQVLAVKRATARRKKATLFVRVIAGVGA